MPGLVIFRRRWSIASDDFVYPSIGEFALRLSWLIVLLVIYGYHYDDFSCKYADNLKSFYLGTVVINSVAMINNLALMGASMQGTIKQQRSRRHNVPLFLYIKVLLLIPECVWVGLSSYWVFGHSYSCDWTVLWTARGAVMTSWAIGCLMFVLFLAIFDPLGALEDRNAVRLELSSSGEDQVLIGSVSHSHVWEARCRLLCCCIACKQDTQQGFTQVAKLVSDFFHDLDLVPTDILAGLILVQKQQFNEDSQLSAIIVNSIQTDNMNEGADLPSGSGSGGGQVSPIESAPKDWMTIDNMSHYMRYAMGSYGWPFYMFEYLATGLCRLCSQCQCCSCKNGLNSVFDDNCCQCNTAAIKKLTGAQNCDLVYVTFHNKFKEIPFYVAVDRCKNTVVVSIRGTLSLRDALADVSAGGAVLEIPGVDKSYCHEAMLDCARYIQGRLEELHLLDHAFSLLQPDAGLLVTGHSLGAGVASILSVLLRPSHPDLMCFAFSPPGGLMSPSASRYTKDFICSVVLGKDVVPRLGMYTLLSLKVKILRALCQCQSPKYQILASGCFRLLCCKASTDKEGRDSSREVLVPRYADEQNCIIENALRSAETKMEEILHTQWPLHPAGQILHIMDVNEEGAGCGVDPQYCAVWSSPEYFDKIVISHKMVADHLPNAVNDALQQLKEKNYTPSARRASQYLRQCSA